MTFRHAVRWLGTALLVGGFTLAAVDQAQAQVLTLRISEAGFPASPTNPLVISGSQTFAQSAAPITIGDYTIQSVVGTSNNPGSASNTVLAMNQISISRGTTTTGAGPLIIEASETNFTQPTGPSTASAAYTINFTTRSTAGDVITFNSWENNNNTLFAQQTTVGGAQTFTAPPGGNPANTPFALQGGPVVLNVTSPFSLTTLVSLNLAVGTGVVLDVQTSNSVSLSAVPEPGSVVMAFSGLPVLGLLWARRRRKS